MRTFRRLNLPWKSILSLTHKGIGIHVHREYRYIHLCKFHRNPPTASCRKQDSCRFDHPSPPEVATLLAGGVIGGGGGGGGEGGGGGRGRHVFKRLVFKESPSPIRVVIQIKTFILTAHEDRKVCLWSSDSGEWVYKVLYEGLPGAIECMEANVRPGS